MSKGTPNRDLEKIAERVAEIYGIKVGEVLARGRPQRRVSARSLFCFWAVREMGNSLASLAIRLGMSPAGVGYAVQRGEAIAQGHPEIMKISACLASGIVNRLFYCLRIEMFPHLW